MANQQLPNEVRLRALWRVVGLGRLGSAVRKFASGKVSRLIRKAIRNPTPENLMNKLHSVWVAPPEPTIGHARAWWNVVATSGLSGRGSGAAWGKLFTEIGEMLIFAPEDLVYLGARQLRLISGNHDTSKLFGRLWRTVKGSGGAKDFSVRNEPCS